MSIRKSLSPLLCVGCLTMLSLLLLVSPMDPISSTAAEEKHSNCVAAISDTRLHGHWSSDAPSVAYSLNVTPQILFFTSADELDILEIAVDQLRVSDTEGSVSGIVKVSRLNHKSTGEEGRRVRLVYRVEAEKLEIEFLEGLNAVPMRRIVLERAGPLQAMGSIANSSMSRSGPIPRILKSKSLPVAS